MAERSHISESNDAFVRKLETFGRLTRIDKDLLRSVSMQPQVYHAGSDVAREGDRPGEVRLVIAGFAFRYKRLSQGGRQIVAYLLPGDVCDLHAPLLDVLDHSIAALTDAQVVKLPHEKIKMLLDRPAIARALLMMTMAYEANGREWLTNNGLRSADKRLLHFLAEWHLRLRSIGLADFNACDFPLTQQHLAETVGLSVVHVNRTLKELRDSGVIALKSRRLYLSNRHQLYEMCDFRPEYLHITTRGCFY